MAQAAQVVPRWQGQVDGRRCVEAQVGEALWQGRQWQRQRVGLRIAGVVQLDVQAAQPPARGGWGALSLARLRACRHRCCTPLPAAACEHMVAVLIHNGLSTTGCAC